MNGAHQWPPLVLLLLCCLLGPRLSLGVGHDKQHTQFSFSRSLGHTLSAFLPA